MSISPVTMSPMILSFVSTKKTEEEDSEYEKIKTMLKMLGIEPTGDKEVDKLVLQQAINDKVSEAANAGSSSAYNPFTDLLEFLEITSTGNVDKDYDNVIDELDYRIYMADDDEEKAYYQSLRDEADSLYTENNYDNQRQDMFMGASQIADYYKFMITG